MNAKSDAVGRRVEESQTAGQTALQGLSAVTDDEIVATSSRPSWRRGARLHTLRLFFFVFVLALWQTASGTFLDARYISTPGEVIRRLVEWATDGTLVFHLSITLQETIMGYLIGSFCGIALGVFLGRMFLLGDIVNPFISALYALPKVALAPLFILWIGIGVSMKIALAAITVFFLVFWNAFRGVRDIDTDLRDVLKVFGATRTKILRYLTMPSALGQIFLGLRLAVPYALIGAVVGEIIASNRGIGYLVFRSSNQFDAAGVFAALITLVIFAVFFNEIVQRVEGRFMHWKE